MKRRELLFTLFATMLGLPALSFIKKVQIRPPRPVRIFKVLREGEYYIHDEFVLFETPSGPVAVSRHCTHLGCIVNFRDDERHFLCPCHQSLFDWDGRYIKGPAKKDLPHFAVKRLKGGQEGYEVLMPRTRLS